MDLDTALQAHTEWKVKLRLAITKQEALDAQTIGADNCCALGKWLHGEARSQYAGLDAFKQTVTRHAAFHREAGNVALCINRRQFDQASRMLDGGTPYAAAASAVASAILGLKKAATTKA